MKTKIIYISGSEVFEMSEIRAAFDQVRAALGLDSETVLFGVPVDAENALPAVESDNAIETVQNTNLDAVESEPVVVGASVCDALVDNVPEIVDEITPEETVLELISDTVEPESEILTAETTQEVVETVENIEPVVAEPVAEPNVAEESDTVIPILSVLSVKDSASPAAMAQLETTVEPIPDNEPVSDDAPVVEPEPVVEALVDSVLESDIEPDIAPETIAVVEAVSVASGEDVVAKNADLDETEDIENFAIDDMIDEEMPVVPVEKTLEQLLESMTPLREDVEAHLDSNVAEQMAEMSTFDEDDNDTDATLAKLASEFAEKQDTITPSPKGTNHGKISKLKSMIPFKKQHREDSSLMGDLFNWAGMAANDDEYSFSGFFSPLSKKTGA